MESLLRAEGYRFRPLDFYDQARVLTREPRPLGSSVAALFGLIYIQDRSSMLPPLALGLDPGETVLDMCASPGGKTGILAQLTGRAGLVLANEPGGKRLVTLRRNLLQNNVMNAVTSGYPGEQFPGGANCFSRILLDVPCSGWGTVEKHPRVTTLWREEKLGPLLNLQRQLLKRCADLLTPGGTLLYSTCTTNIGENEDQVLWAQAQLELKPVDPPLFPGFVFEDPLRKEGAKCLRVQGDASMGQSFFLAALRKKEQEAGTQKPPPAAHSKGQEPENPFEQGICSENIPFGRIEARGHRLELLPESALRELPKEIGWQGFYLGKKREKLLVSARARLLLPPRGRGPELVADRVAELKQLLAGQSFRVAPPKGQRVLGLYYKELPLGWLSIKGSRCFWTDRT